ncbi:hypothetical protein PS834_03024 [Pseudomonas fluorescens]|nr:hypothetical protein PS834_03024 [Pseudomonas fluorescens]
MKLAPKNNYDRQRRIARFRFKAAHRHEASPRIKRVAVALKKPFLLTAPEEIGLHNRTLHDELVKFLQCLRKESLRQPAININFSKTKKVYSTGMLLLLAEIDRTTRATSNHCKMTCGYPADDTVEKVFQQVGLFKIFGKPHRLEITAEDKNVINWKYASDVSVNPKSADVLMKAIKNKVPKGYLRLVTGVGEAMDNAVHHAYVEPRGDRLSGRSSADERRWWVFAEVLDGWLHVVFCDLGLGIPVTLPARWKEQIVDIVRLTTLSPGKRDMRMIRRSLELGRTSTDQGHRGKGLKRNILKAAEELGGKLNVYSNAGVIGVDCQSGVPIYTPGSFHRSILGTVIQWSIPVTDRQDLENEHDTN